MCGMPSARFARRGRFDHLWLTLEDPDSSSIAGRRARGFLQVSLSKVSRPPHRGARPASSAEPPPMNANDYAGVIRSVLGLALRPPSATTALA